MPILWTEPIEMYELKQKQCWKIIIGFSQKLGTFYTSRTFQRRFVYFQELTTVMTSYTLKCCKNYIDNLFGPKKKA